MSRSPGRRTGMSGLMETGILAILDWGNNPDERRITAGARALAQGGVRAFQLRAKGLEDRRFVPLALAIRRALPGCAVTVNDRCDIALIAGADGVHLGTDDLPSGPARAMLGPEALVGVSAGSPREVRSQVRPGIDYLSIGPVFSTGTKADAGRPLSCRGFRKLALLAPPRLPLLAVGGITSDNVHGLVECGADAVAVASWWWKADGPERAARWMVEAVAEARKTSRVARKRARRFGGSAW